MHSEELSRLAAPIAEHRQNRERLSFHHIDALVPAVSEIDVFLLWIARERDVPD